MTAKAIQVNRISKKYLIGATGRRSEESLREWLMARLNRGRHDAREVALWALKNVSFEVGQGEVVGIIGRNGAGKSTLLKILSRITEPSAGRVVLTGRVGSLLEVGTGFHPELTGRENIFLSGAILGMTRREIERKFDEIVAFSDLARFIDTPIKRYSSGMNVRLGFSVAAHLEPEILLVDEVLAVGDAEFQSKCLGLMSDEAKGGRTVLFVSHDMAAIERLCQRALFIQDGKIELDDRPRESIRRYLGAVDAKDGTGRVCYEVNNELLAEQVSPEIRVTRLELHGEAGKPLRRIATGEALRLSIDYETIRPWRSPALDVSLRGKYGQELIRVSTTPISGFPLGDLGRSGRVTLTFPELPLTAGRYSFDVAFVQERIRIILSLPSAVSFEVSKRDVYGGGMALDSSHGVLALPHSWQHEVTESARD